MSSTVGFGKLAGSTQVDELGMTPRRPGSAAWVAAESREGCGSVAVERPGQPNVRRPPNRQAEPWPEVTAVAARVIRLRLPRS